MVPITIDKQQFLHESFFPEDFSHHFHQISQNPNKVYLPYFRAPVGCSHFGISEDFIEKYQSLDARFVKNKSSTFFFEATGKSMTPTISPGDVLVVDRSIENFHSKVCIVCHQGEMLCKRVLIKKNHVILCSDNPKYSPLVIRNPEHTLFWGVVIAKASEVS